MRIYSAILRQAVATFGHVRLCTLPQVILAFLVLLVSTHLRESDKAFHELYGKIENTRCNDTLPTHFNGIQYNK